MTLGADMQSHTHHIITSYGSLVITVTLSLELWCFSKRTFNLHYNVLQSHFCVFPAAAVMSECDVPAYSVYRRNDGLK